VFSVFELLLRRCSTGTIRRNPREFFLDKKLEVIVRREKRRRWRREAPVDEKARSRANAITFGFIERLRNGIAEFATFHTAGESLAVQADSGRCLSEPGRVDDTGRHQRIVIRPELALRIGAECSFLKVIRIRSPNVSRILGKTCANRA
jgi:hypothetical protein